jgi:diacylglycerol O-acyltransferase
MTSKTDQRIERNEPRKGSKASKASKSRPERGAAPTSADAEPATESGDDAEIGKMGRGLQPVEVFMRKMSRDPRTRTAAVAIFLLDQEPDWDRLVYTWDRLSRSVPRYRQRLVDQPLGLPSVWMMDPDFDLDYHVRRIRAPEPGTLPQLFDLARTMLMAELDQARPLWEVTLIEGLEGGRAAILQKADHAIGDGQGGLRIMQVLLDTTRDADPGAMPPAPEPEDVAPTAVLRASIAERLRSATSDGPQGVSRMMSAAGNAFRRPWRAVPEALGMAASAGRMIAPMSTRRSPLLRGRSLSYHFDVLEVGLDDLKRAAKAAGGTITDGFVAAVAGALGSYHERLGSPVEQLTVGLPVSTRHAGDALASNHFSVAFLAAPTNIADPRARIERIHEQVRQLRSERALPAIEEAAPLLGLLPDALFQAAMSAGAPEVNASSVRGFDRDVYTAGAKIERMYGFGPLAGGAMLIGLVSMFDICCVTLNLDPAAFTEPDLLMDCLQESFEEILELGGPHQAVTTPARTTPASG